MGVAGVAHLGLFGVLLPWGVLRAKRRLARGAGRPPRDRYFLSVILEQLIFLSVSLAVSKLEWIPVFTAPILTPATLGLTAALFAMHAVVGIYRARLRVRRRDPGLWRIAPQTGKERGLWATISLLAGVGEEITYRGVFVTLLQRLTHSFPVAAGLSAIVFGVSHATQGWTVAAIVAGYAVGWHLLAWLSGSLVLGMLVHVVHDLWIGFYVGHRVAREGGDPQEPTAA